LIGIISAYKAAIYVDASISQEYLSPHLYWFAHISLWALYGFIVGLFSTGLWVIAHECGHQAFSESKFINNAVGWVLHSACVITFNIHVDASFEHFTLNFRLGVPYHSWRITHAKHHASAGHMSEDQVFVPKARSQRRLPPLDPAREDPMGRSVSEEAKQELWEALGDSPIGATVGCMGYLVILPQ
jgi:omega-6 fatty acid desaturase / acyl-lipid omega-6 desaturase (Delta-12 desaturase)